MWLSSIETGDWVVLREPVTRGFFDVLNGHALPAGTKGVVLDVSGARVRVAFDTGYGTIECTVRPSQVRRFRRAGGVTRFTDRARVRGIARTGLVLVLIWPIIWFVIQYVWFNHTVEGITTEFAIGIVESGWEFLNAAILHPVRAILFLGFMGVLSWFTVRH